jgi:enoyl-CoA hydratase/carnithine racemase
MSEAQSTDAPLVLVERVEGNVAVVRLNRPKVNALSPELTDAIGAAFDALRADLPGAVVLTGGERIFAAGADIARFGGPDEAKVIGGRLREVFDGIDSFPRVVIAAVNGFALGGGCELAMSCDLRVASEAAKFGQPEILLGIIPGAGGTQRLARLVGPSRAKDICLSGRQVDAAEALRLGLADRVVPAAETITAAVTWAQEFARGPLTVQQYCLEAIDGGLDGSLSDGLTLEQDRFVASFGTEDAGIGIPSFLANGPGKAAFTGR